MDFRLDDEQRRLRDSVDRFCATRFPAQRIAEREGRPLERSTWREIAQLGVFGLLLSEDDGGAGLGVVEAAIVFEQLGAHLAGGPVLWGPLA